MLLKIAAALIAAHLLPGLALAGLLGLGRSREERLVVGAALGGPLAAALYFAAAVLEAPAIYGAALVGIDAVAVAHLMRGWRKLAWSWPWRSGALLGSIALSVLTPYLLTTGSLYRTDASGSLLVDRALQRDALFHLGIVHALETRASPALLSVSAEPVGYHAGYHLQLAGWSRFFGVTPMDGLIRAAPVLHIALWILSAYLLATRFVPREPPRLLFALLVLGTGLGFLFFARPSVDWWSLTFMDVTLVSVFLANPLLPALPLLFAGLALLEDYRADGGLGTLLGYTLALGSLFAIKMFTGAHVLAAVGLAALFGAGRRCWKALGALLLVSSPLVLHTFLAAEGSNTAVTLRPLEIVRYAMEKIDWPRAEEALAAVGAFELTPSTLLTAAGATLLWTVGFLGLRLIGLRGVVADLRRSSPIAWFAVIGIPLTLVFRVAPAEAEGLSRLEAQNDVVWFAAQSGIVLWLWAASALARLRPVVAAALVVAFALPGTVQHFVHAASLAPDRLGRTRVEAAEAARSLSSAEAVWLEPLERSRPSLLPYVAGRAVVYDPYVGYDYMFFGRAAIDLRRHAVAQFWASEDLAFQAWVLDHFDVSFVWREGASETAADLLETIFANEDVTLYRVRKDAVARARRETIETPPVVSLGGRGHPYVSSGLRPEERAWRLRGASTLYLPRAEGRELTLRLELRAPHDAGRLGIAGEERAIVADTTELVVSLPAAPEDGLFALEVLWRGEAPLDVMSVRTSGP